MAEYIEREALIEAIGKAAASCAEKAFETGIYDGSLLGMSVAMGIAKTIPAADVSPVRHGRWDKAGYDLARCSFCHTVRKTDFARDHYCPNCGAKMDGEETEK